MDGIVLTITVNTAFKCLLLFRDKQHGVYTVIKQNVSGQSAIRSVRRRTREGRLPSMCCKRVWIQVVFKSFCYDRTVLEAISFRVLCAKRLQFKRYGRTGRYRRPGRILKYRGTKVVHALWISFILMDNILNINVKKEMKKLNKNKTC